MIFKVLFALMGLVVLNSAMKSYENYRVYNIVPKSEEQVQILTDLRKDDYDFWSDVFTVDTTARVMVSPNKHEEFLRYNQSVGLNAVLSIPNVQELINAQMRHCDSCVQKSSSLGSLNWQWYHSLADIHAWLDELPQLYPGIVTTVTMGTSFEGRPLKGIIIDFKAGNRGDKPLIGMIEGGIHAREWISPATVTWIIKEFLTSQDSDVRFMAETFIWHIFPVVNPDGYVYTFTNDRMWRKNRHTANAGSCGVNDDLSNGIDLNRNFNFLWMTTGASSDPCAQTYAGPSPSSELEAQAISRYVLSLKERGNFIYYFAFHSFSQMILVPYSHVSGFDVLQADNYADMYEIAIRGAEKLTKRHGTPYVVGTSAEILYEVSGSSFDWVKGVADIPIVYLFELRDVGEYGFLLPSDQIIPNNEEIMDCLVEMEKTTRTLGYYTPNPSDLTKSSAATVLVNVLLIAATLVLAHQ